MRDVSLGHMVFSLVILLTCCLGRSRQVGGRNGLLRDITT